MRNMEQEENILIWRRLTGSKVVYNLQKIMYIIKRDETAYLEMFNIFQ